MYVIINKNYITLIFYLAFAEALISEQDSRLYDIKTIRFGGMQQCVISIYEKYWRKKCSLLLSKDTATGGEEYTADDGIVLFCLPTFFGDTLQLKRPQVVGIFLFKHNYYQFLNYP